MVVARDRGRQHAFLGLLRRDLRLDDVHPLRPATTCAQAWAARGRPRGPALWPEASESRLAHSAATRPNGGSPRLPSLCREIQLQDVGELAAVLPLQPLLHCRCTILSLGAWRRPAQSSPETAASRPGCCSRCSCWACSTWSSRASCSRPAPASGSWSLFLAGLSLGAAVPLGQAGARVDGRQGRHPRRGARPPRDDRAALHPGRPAEAEDRDRRHDVPNAFAMGRSQKRAIVCATTGIIETLEPHELEGVMAHELTHVKNRDVMIMTIASFFAAIASMITQFGFFFGGGVDDDDDDGPASSSCCSLVRRLHHLVLPDARAVALPRVRRRPRRRADHRPAERARPRR